VTAATSIAPPAVQPHQVWSTLSRKGEPVDPRWTVVEREGEGWRCRRHGGYYEIRVLTEADLRKMRCVAGPGSER
jgi:hypothetical protein